ncbi:MAG: transglycosylase domain-containing protein, partial [Coprobacillus sp.]
RKKIKKIVLISLATVLAFGTIYMGVAVFDQISGFSKEKLMSGESSTILTADTGNDDSTEFYSYGSGGVRKNVAYEDIPQIMIDAVVAAEDSRFFEHNGFDIPRIVKALMCNIIAMDITGGGSTITQQVIKKSYYPKEEQTIQRKIGEVILSIEATSQTTKEEILELYLNKIYFGYGNKAIGIYAASRYYFDKSVQNLTLPEAALLAGTLNSPNQFDPFRNLDLAQKRRDTILDLMELHGYITKEECAVTKKIPVENTLKSNPLNAGGKYQAYADKVTREVYEKTGYDPNKTPMKIYTYMDTSLQEELDNIAKGESFEYTDKYIQAGASVQESQTGRIIGVMSGRNYEPMGTTFAYAASKERVAKKELAAYGQRNQPGSSLKPIISYAAAFEYLDYSTAHYVHDVPFVSGNYSPKNWDNKFHGDISIKSALSSSWNLAAINTYNEVINKIGKDKMKSYLESFGFDMYDETALGSQYAIGGWSTGVSPEEEAGAYAAIANGGTYITPHTVQKIILLEENKTIELDEQFQNEKKQALSAESSFMIRDVMTSYVKDGTGSYSRLNLGYQIGAKTGTSNHSTNKNEIPNPSLAGKSKDGWMTAFSPDYSWSVWSGYTSADQKKGMYYKGSDAARMCAAIAKAVHGKQLKNSYPTQPTGISQDQCISGIYPYVSVGSGVPSDRVVTGWFKNSNKPTGSASGSTLNSLASFTASLADNKISVNFTPYDPESRTQSGTPTKTYTTGGGGSVTLPYLGDINQIYGKVVYVVDVLDAAGTVIHSEKLSTATATLNYTPPAGTYTLSGYYALENDGTTSNKITQTITSVGSPTASTSYSKKSLTATTLVLHFEIPTGSKVVATVSGASKELTTSGDVTFSSLVANTEYTITFVETTATGDVHNLTPFKFTTPAA